MKTPLFLFLTSFLTLSPIPTQAQELITINMNKMCAAIVNIPYGSDNFSDAEWAQFLQCKEFVKYFQE